MVVSTSNGPVILHKKDLQKWGKTTVVTVKEPIDELEPINATYFRRVDYNCTSDNWKKLTDSDDRHLHLFFTGASSKRIQFGCAPSPYFLNVSNYIFGGQWAGNQLTAHEIGSYFRFRSHQLSSVRRLTSKRQVLFWLPV